MQDRFKVRAWDRTHKVMFDVDNIYFLSSNVENFQLDRVCYSDGDNCTLTQCTGLKDKNGNLIYEGDILALSHLTGKYVMVWDSYSWVVQGIPGKNRFYSEQRILEQNIYEVIGNKYENPELLKDEEV